MFSGTFCGDFGRDHYLNNPSVAELFLYSNKDFYLPWKYLEKQVLLVRKQKGANFTAVKFAGSGHVTHLKKHKKKYKNAVLEFVEKNSREL